MRIVEYFFIKLFAQKKQYFLRKPRKAVSSRDPFFAFFFEEKGHLTSEKKLLFKKKAPDYGTDM